MNQHRFVWHELGTRDVAGAKRFYGEVFGWKLEGSDYVHISAGDRMIGGVRALGANEHQPPAWLAYVLVEDVARTVAAIEAQRGRVYMPTTVMDKVGTFAVTADPTGAVFAPWRSARDEENRPEPASAPMPGLGMFCWDELVTTDPAAAATFYASVFGWDPQALEMGGGSTYTLFHRPGTRGPGGQPIGAGGMMKSPPGVEHSFWLPYVAVDDVDRASARAAQLGGKVMVPPTDIPNIGRFACWSDPQQAAIAVLAPAAMK